VALGKETFAECFFLELGKKTSLPSVFYLTLGKAFCAECRGFAECFLFDTRQSLLCRVQRLCRAPKKKNTQQSLRRSAKKRIPVVIGDTRDLLHDHFVCSGML
jgi:hypothetical protein